MSDWISVEDKKPNYYEDLILWLEYAESSVISTVNAESFTDNVTHWMPLPQPPKECDQ